MREAEGDEVMTQKQDAAIASLVTAPLRDEVYDPTETFYDYPRRPAYLRRLFNRLRRSFA